MDSKALHRWLTLGANLAGFFTEGGTLSVNGTANEGREAITSLANGFMTAFPDMELVNDKLEILPEAVHYHWTFIGTNTGEGGTGNAIRFSGFEAWVFSEDGLVPIALSYGVAPSFTMEKLFGISLDSTNLAHIFRAVMGLYLGMVIFWFLGAFNSALTRPALIGCAVFMLGLASGRILSFLVDGQPHWLLVLYAVLEITLGLIALRLFKDQPANSETHRP